MNTLALVLLIGALILTIYSLAKQALPYLAVAVLLVVVYLIVAVAQGFKL